MSAHRLTEEQRALAGDPAGLRVARQVAALFARRTSADRADLEGAALLGLCHAARRFDPARGVKFATFAAAVVRGFVLDHLREQMPAGFRRADHGARGRGEPVPAVRSLADRIDRDREGGRPLADVLDSGELPVGWEVESQDDLSKLCRELSSARQAEIVRLFYSDAAVAGSAERVAERVGISAPGVWRALWEARRFLRGGTPVRLRQHRGGGV